MINRPTQTRMNLQNTKIQFYLCTSLNSLKITGYKNIQMTKQSHTHFHGHTDRVTISKLILHPQTTFHLKQNPIISSAYTQSLKHIQAPCRGYTRPKTHLQGSTLFTVMKAARSQSQQSHMAFTQPSNRTEKYDQLPGQRNKWSQTPCHKNTLITPQSHGQTPGIHTIHSRIHNLKVIQKHPNTLSQQQSRTAHSHKQTPSHIRRSHNHSHTSTFPVS